MFNHSIEKDISHIELIKKNLWIEKSSVMIGAGFSCNAIKISPNAPDFPLYSDLICHFLKRLHPELIISDGFKLKSKIDISNFDFTELATEYKGFFGESALYELLCEIIPDNQYIPGDLHKKILELPWTDIFTTNYDTLLERARYHVVDRYYDLIYTQNDIPLKSKPRIVKLHGSFPSLYPFIITSEDFENYPSNYGAFTNLVQQSLMENTLCLIGYSGNDPNFKMWIKWVKENLGKSMRPVYLIGLMDLTKKDCDNYRELNIIPINLYPLVKKFKQDIQHNDHNDAISWFLDELFTGQPVSKLRWPLNLDSEKKSLIERYSEIDNQDQHSNTSILNQFGQVNLSPELVLKWTKDRINYPGWIVCPLNNCELLLHKTDQNFYPLINFLDSQNHHLKLIYLHEYVWRLETCLFPLHDDLAKKIEEIISQNDSDENNCSINEEQNDIISQLLESHPYESSLVFLKFALIRYYRERGKDEDFIVLINDVEKKYCEKSEYYQRLINEKCLYCFERLKHSELLQLLDIWVESEQYPYYIALKAKYFAELGNFDRSIQLAEKALNLIRISETDNNSDIFLMSEEGWTSTLLENLKRVNHNDSISEKYDDAIVKNRLNRLKEYKCNPNLIIDEFIDDLKSTFFDENEKLGRNSKQFDLFRSTISDSFLFSSKLYTDEILKSYRWIKVLELGTIPYKLGPINIHSEVTIKSSKYLSPVLPLYLFFTAVRCNYEFEKIGITQLDIIKIDESHFKTIFYCLIDTLNSSILDIEQNPYKLNIQNCFGSYRNLLVIPEILSYFSIRLQENEMFALINLLLRFFNSEKIIRYTPLLSRNSDVLNRALSSSDYNILLRELSHLMDCPIAGINPYENLEINYSERIFSNPYWVDGLLIPNTFDRIQYITPIKKLIQIILQGPDKSRKIAIQRLLVVHSINGLSDEEINLISDSVWNENWLSQKTGLPESIPSFYSLFVFSKHRQEQLFDGYRNFLKNFDYPRLIVTSTSAEGKREITSMSSGGAFTGLEKILVNHKPLFPNEDSITYYEFSAEEILSLLCKFTNFWNDQNIGLTSSNRLFNSNNFRYYIVHCIEILEKIVLPNVSLLSDPDKVTVEELIRNFPNYGIPNLHLLPFVLQFHPEEEKEIFHKLKQGIYSQNLEMMEKSIDGCVNWIMFRRNGLIEVKANDVISLFIDILDLRLKSPIISVIHRISKIFSYDPNIFNECHIAIILDTLEYLLTETDYNNKSSFFDDNEKMECRTICVKFSTILYSYYHRGMLPISPIINQWILVGKTDVIPDVRKGLSSEIQLLLNI